MLKLSIATAKGRRNTAGCIKLAVFFLFCLNYFTACPLNASGIDSQLLPYVTGSKLYSFNPQAENSDNLIQYDFFNMAEGFTQNATASSKKKGYILAWNQKKQRLYHIADQKLVSNVELKASLVYAGSDYILAQSSSFAENKGFSFTLYSIKYSFNGRKIKLRSLWSGYIDCFVSDFFFTAKGVCLAGGNRDDTKNNVFYISEKGIHKCFTTAKNSDFLRLINPDKSGDSASTVYAFLSGREKSAAQSLIYKFNLDAYAEGNDPACQIDLSADPELPDTFQCFFGYGFGIPAVGESVETTSLLVLPASLDGIINFICYDCESGKISNIIPDAIGCLTPLTSTEEGTYYIARDPLIEGSWYGIALFNGRECKKIAKF